MIVDHPAFLCALFPDFVSLQFIILTALIDSRSEHS